MDNFKCLTVFDCDVLNKKDNVVPVDLFEACERNLQDFSLSQKIGVIPLILSCLESKYKDRHVTIAACL